MTYNEPYHIYNEPYHSPTVHQCGTLAIVQSSLVCQRHEYWVFQSLT